MNSSKEVPNSVIQSAAAQKAHKLVLEALCNQIDDARTKSKNHRIPYGFVQKKLDDLKEELSWLPGHKIYNALESCRAHEERERKTALESALKDASTVSEIIEDTHQNTPKAAAESAEVSDIPSLQSTNECNNFFPSRNHKRDGRPKGTTDESK